MTKILKTDIRAKFAEGRFNPSLHESDKLQAPTFVKMIVLDVVSDPNADNVDEEKKQKWHEMHVTNMQYADVLPRNTIVAQRVGEESNPMFVFPFFPSHLALPCKAGECVWVMSENPAAVSSDIAYWFCRVVEPHTADDVNHSHPGRSSEGTIAPSTKDRMDSDKDGTAESGENVWYELRNGLVRVQGGERVTSSTGVILKGEREDVFETIATESDASKSTTYESVPRFRKRPADIALEGSNNTLIVLGTDRTGPVLHSLRDLKGSGAGSIDIVVGRGQTDDTSGKAASTTSIKNAAGKKKGTEIKKELNKSPDVLAPSEGDVDLKNDRSRISVSQRTTVDENYGLSSYNSSSSVSDSPLGDAAVVIKTDKVRIIARSDAEILVKGFEMSKDNGRLDRKDEKDDNTAWASITIKSNGDIVVRPSDKGYLKLGDDSADRALLCTDLPATVADGKVLPTTPPLTNTMGGRFGGTGIATQGTWAKKILVTGAK